MCFMRICDYKFAVYGFFAEHKSLSMLPRVAVELHGILRERL